MENLKQERETAYERLLGEMKQLRSDLQEENADLKAENQSRQLRTIGIILGGVAVLLALFGLILRAGL